MARINSIKAVAVSFEEVTIGECRLIHADCRDVLPTLPRFDLLLTDPPYGIDVGAMNMGAGKKTMVFDAFAWDEKPPSPNEFAALLAKCDAAIIWGGNYFSLPPSGKFLSWDKMQRFSGADFELAYTSLSGPSKVFRLSRVEAYGATPRLHPTQKPLALMAWCLTHTPTAKTVLDPFMGSGTTGVACAQSGRSFTGIERERKYFDIAVERISRAYAQGKLFAPEIVKPEQGALV